MLWSGGGSGVVGAGGGGGRQRVALPHFLNQGELCELSKPGANTEEVGVLRWPLPSFLYSRGSSVSYQSQRHIQRGRVGAGLSSPLTPVTKGELCELISMTGAYTSY